MIAHKFLESLEKEKIDFDIFSAIKTSVDNSIKFDMGNLDELSEVKPFLHFDALPPFPKLLLQFDMGENHALFSHLIVIFSQAFESSFFEASSGIKVESDDDNEIFGAFLPSVKVKAKDEWRPFDSFVVLKHKRTKQFSFVFGNPSLNNPSFIKSERGQVSNAVLSLCCTCFFILSCSNVKTLDIEAPLSLNKKRSKKGKLPIYSYKVLTLTGEQNERTNNGGTHASPRVHLRRGHIRKLPDKNVWVQPCVVGDKSRGVVMKDYKWQSGEMQ